MSKVLDNRQQEDQVHDDESVTYGTDQVLPAGYEYDEDGIARRIPEHSYEITVDPRRWVSMHDEANWPTYLETLAKTGRYMAAAASVGTSRESALQKRKSCPRFKALCDEALAVYRSTVEAELQRRAMHGRDKPIFYMGKLVAVVKEPSDKLLLAIAKRHIPAYRDSEGKGTRVTVNNTNQAAAGTATLMPGLDMSKLDANQRDLLKAFLESLPGTPALAGDVALPGTELAPHVATQHVLDVPSTELAQRAPRDGEYDATDPELRKPHQAPSTSPAAASASPAAVKQDGRGRWPRKPRRP